MRSGARDVLNVAARPRRYDLKGWRRYGGGRDGYRAYGWQGGESSPTRTKDGKILYYSWQYKCRQLKNVIFINVSSAHMSRRRRGAMVRARGACGCLSAAPRALCRRRRRRRKSRRKVYGRDRAAAPARVAPSSVWTERRGCTRRFHLDALEKHNGQTRARSFVMYTYTQCAYLQYRTMYTCARAIVCVRKNAVLFSWSCAITSKYGLLRGRLSFSEPEESIGSVGLRSRSTPPDFLRRKQWNSLNRCKR